MFEILMLKESNSGNYYYPSFTTENIPMQGDFIIISETEGVEVLRRILPANSTKKISLIVKSIEIPKIE